jgi:hypothetical protein
MAMSGFYVAIEVAMLLLWPGDSSAMLAILPFMIGGFFLKVIGAWLGAGGTAARVPVSAA